MTYKQASKIRIFKGSVISVGSNTGKVLISSIDAAKIMDAVRKASTGEITTVKLSEETARKVSAIAS